MHVAASPRQNQLLAALPTSVLERLSPDLELILIPRGEVLHEPGAPLHYVYFPTSAIVSRVYLMEDGGSTDGAMTGNDGMIGIALFMGGETMPHRAVVLSGGYAYRLPSSVLKREFNRFGGRRNGAFNRLLLRYAQALFTQMAQMSVCNLHHSLAQRLCCMLLMSVDRSPSNELTMTQDLIANLLGVRREGVTEEAGKLQAAGLIQYRRGHIAVLDRAGLEARACECYGLIKREADRLLPRPIIWMRSGAEVRAPVMGAQRPMVIGDEHP
jgi:CRP-like cAMP-binding protein